MISNLSFTYEKNVVFATNSDILFISVQPHVVNIFSNSEFFKIIKTNFGMSKIYFRFSLISLYSRFYKEIGGSNSKYLCIPGSTRRWVDLILKLQ